MTLFSTSTVTRKYCLSEIEGNITNAKASFERIDLCNTRGQGLSKWLLNNFDTANLQLMLILKLQMTIKDPGSIYARIGVEQMLSFAGCCILLMLFLAVDVFVVVLVVVFCF